MKDDQVMEAAAPDAWGGAPSPSLSAGGPSLSAGGSSLSAGGLALMAVASGASAANLFYNQPLLETFGRLFHATATQASLVATAAQVGYGVGMFFFVPMGDLYDRRRLILPLVFACAGFLLLTTLAGGLWLLIAGHLLIGITATSPQLLVPLAIDLSPREKRGHTVGVLMGGLLFGVLLARVVSGYVSDHFGWRVMYVLAAGIMCGLGVALSAGLPRRAATLRMSYGALMGSMVHLLRTQPRIWHASLMSAVSFATFTAFWAGLSFLMVDRYHRGASEAGLLAVVALAGAGAAPLAGRLSDRRGTAFTLTIALVCTIAAFVLMAVNASVAALVAGVFLMDLGVQSVQVGAQTSVIALVPEARSRVNTLYMVTRFAGGAAGSVLGAKVYSAFGWPGVCWAATAGLAVTLLGHLLVVRVLARRSAAAPVA